MRWSKKLFEKSRRDAIAVARHVSAGSEARERIESREGRHLMSSLPGLRRDFSYLIPSTDVLGYCCVVPTGLCKQLLCKFSRKEDCS